MKINNKISNKSFKKALKKALQDEEVIECLRKLLSGEIFTSVEVDETPQESTSNDDTSATTDDEHYYQKECAKSVENNKSLTEQVKSLEGQLADKDGKIKSLEDKLSQKEIDLTGKENEIKALNINLSNKEKELTTANGKVKSLEGQLSQKTQELETEKRGTDELKAQNQQLSDKIVHWKDYESADRVYTMYNGLSENLKNQIHGIFHCNSPETFFACAGKKDFIERFWTFSVQKVRSGLDESNTLIEIFDVLFDVFNDSEISKRYERMNVEIGGRYDINTQSNMNDLAQGRVARVVMRGYKELKDGKIKGKSLVEVE